MVGSVESDLTPRTSLHKQHNCKLFANINLLPSAPKALHLQPFYDTIFIMSETNRLDRLTILNDPKLFVSEFLLREAITITGNGTFKGTQYPPDILATDIHLAHQQQVRLFNGNIEPKSQEPRAAQTTKAQISDVLNLLVEDSKIAARKELFAQLVCTGEDLTELRKAIRCADGEEKDLHVYSMAHALWCIKRNIGDLKVRYHLMVILYGKQGAGKNTWLEQLLSPIFNFVLFWDLQELTDSRNHFALSSNLACIIDELAGAPRVAIEALKKIITASFLSPRRLHTHANPTIPQRCTFFGSTNKPLSESLYDSTGMRRYAVIKTQDKLDWEGMKDVDPFKLFRGIDETLENGYLNRIQAELTSHQAELVTKDEMDLYVEEHRVAASEEGYPSETYLVSEIYTDYVAWSARNGFKPCNVVWFGRKLSRFGIRSSVEAERRVYSVKEGSGWPKEAMATTTAPSTAHRARILNLMKVDK